MRGIYKITNKVNGKVYIGESLDLERRWKEHLLELSSKQHINHKLQKDYNIYGYEAFKFEILATLDKNISNYVDKFVNVIYEDIFITEYNSIEEGYNIERTLDKVLNGEKQITNNINKDKGVLKNYLNRYEEGYIFIKDNVIYYKKPNKTNRVKGRNNNKRYSFKHLEKESNRSKEDILKIFNKLGILNIDDKDRINIDERILSRKLIMNNVPYDNFEFNHRTFKTLLNILKGINLPTIKNVISNLNININLYELKDLFDKLGVFGRNGRVYKKYSKYIIPLKYKDKEGNIKVSFRITKEGVSWLKELLNNIY